MGSFVEMYLHFEQLIKVEKFTLEAIAEMEVLRAEDYPKMGFAIFVGTIIS